MQELPVDKFLEQLHKHIPNESHLGTYLAPFGGTGLINLWISPWGFILSQMLLAAFPHPR